MSQPEKRTLLQRYGIPISHLDFDYIKTCQNAKEMERIVAILRSGEEGYFAELTKCAEDKLQELNPRSRALRTEDHLLTKHNFTTKDWKEQSAPITEWSTEIKNKESEITKLEDALEIELPPIRKGGKLNGTKQNNSEALNKKKETPPVAGTNYRQWDKYDADAELLKMDLEEERNRENVERNNRINKQKSAKIEVIKEKKTNVYDKMSRLEREKLAEEFKIRGNEYFKAKEYTNALEQYTRCIEVQPSAVAFNNRAVTNLKLQKYAEALADCNECLKLDESNLKAWLRQAEAYLGLDRKHDAYRSYDQAKFIEPTNAIACKGLENLRKELGDVAPLHATRLQISEIIDDDKDVKTSNGTVVETSNKKTLETSNKKVLETPNNKVVSRNNAIQTSNNKAIEPSKNKVIEKSKPAPKPIAKPQPKPPKDYDLAELIKPNKLVKNNLMKTMENIGQLTGGKKAPEKQKTQPSKTQIKDQAPEFNLKIMDPFSNNRDHHGGKMLIQEM